jgi:hypothetical protein
VIEVPPVARIDGLVATPADHATALDLPSPPLAEPTVSGAVLAVVLRVDWPGLSVTEAEAVPN